MKKDDLVYIREPHWAAGVSGLFVGDDNGCSIVAIQWEGALEQIRVPIRRYISKIKRQSLELSFFYSFDNKFCSFAKSLFLFCLFV